MGNNSALLKKPPTATSLLFNPVGMAVEPWTNTGMDAKENPGPAHKPNEETQLKKRWMLVR